MKFKSMLINIPYIRKNFVSEVDFEHVQFITETFSLFDSFYRERV